MESENISLFLIFNNDLRILEVLYNCLQYGIITGPSFVLPLRRPITHNLLQCDNHSIRIEFLLSQMNSTLRLHFEVLVNAVIAIVIYPRPGLVIVPLVLGFLFEYFVNVRYHFQNNLVIRLDAMTTSEQLQAIIGQHGLMTVGEGVQVEFLLVNVLQ